MKKQRKTNILVFYVHISPFVKLMTMFFFRAFVHTTMATTMKVDDDLVTVDIISKECIVAIEHKNETMITALVYSNILLYILLLLFVNFILVGMLGIVVYNEHNQLITFVVGMI